MAISPETKLPWIVFSLDKQHYAIPCDFAREMATFNEHIEVPQAADYVRGVINLRGQVMTLVDLRVWVGLQSARKDVEHLVSELRKREEDHREWLNELESSIREKRAFTKTTNPHQCAFGKWYDNYTNDDILIRFLLREFDLPHKTIHAVAAKAIAAAERGDNREAQRVIDEARDTTLQLMIRLFARIREAIETSLHEIAVVLRKDEQSCAVVVDSVESVEPLKATFDSTSLMYRESESSRIPWIGRRPKDDSPVLIPDVTLLFDQL